MSNGDSKATVDAIVRLTPDLGDPGWILVGFRDWWPRADGSYGVRLTRRRHYTELCDCPALLVEGVSYADRDLLPSSTDTALSEVIEALVYQLPH